MLINVILRVLPFYIREPLVIAVCLFFTGLAFYWFVTAGGWGRAGVGLMFLAVGALRAYFFRKEWRSHRAAKAGVSLPRRSAAPGHETTEGVGPEGKHRPGVLVL